MMGLNESENFQLSKSVSEIQYKIDNINKILVMNGDAYIIEECIHQTTPSSAIQSGIQPVSHTQQTIYNGIHLK